MKEEYLELTTVHYLTDSPTGQYGNKYLIQIIANHEVDFGIQIDGPILKRFIERAFVMASEPA